MIEAKRYVFTKGSRCTVDVVCQEIAVDDGGTEREPTPEELAEHAHGFVIRVGPLLFTLEEWRARARKLFGDNPLDWRFVCPSCGHVAKVSDWRDAGAPDTTAAFSCVGRWLGADGSKTFHGKGGPCNYAGGGLFRLNPVTVVDPDGVERHVFAFAEDQ